MAKFLMHFALIFWTSTTGSTAPEHRTHVAVVRCKTYAEKGKKIASNTSLTFVKQRTCSISHSVGRSVSWSVGLSVGPSVHPSVGPSIAQRENAPKSDLTRDTALSPPIRD